MIWVIKGSDERIQDFNGMVSYITLWRQLSVLVSHIRLHIAQSISFRIIQMLGTFCIDRCRPFMIKKVQIHYVIRSLHVNMRILRFKRKNMLKSYNNKISPLFSTDCLIGETKYDQDAHQKISGIGIVAFKGSRDFSPLRTSTWLYKKRLVFQRHKITFFSFP